MLKVKFAYDEPMLGDMEIDGRREDYSDDELIKMFEIAYPEAIDVEILEVEEING